MLIILHKMSQDNIFEQFFNNYPNYSNLEPNIARGQNKGTKNTYSENVHGEEMKSEIGENNKKNLKKRIKKKPVKKIRIKRDFNNQKIIAINSYNSKMNKKRKRPEKNKEKFQNKFSYYFKKKSRNKSKKILYQESSNNYGGSIISSLTNLNEGRPGPENQLKFDNENIKYLFVGIEEEEYDIYNMEIIPFIAWNQDYQT